MHDVHVPVYDCNWNRISQRANSYLLRYVTKGGNFLITHVNIKEVKLLMIILFLDNYIDIK